MKSITLLTLVFICQLAFGQDHLKVGDTVHDFKAINQKGDSVSLSDKLKNGKVVLVFYRGHWCPYCKQHIAKLQDSLQLITDKGASVLVVTPEQPEYINQMQKTSGATFDILYDMDYSIMKVMKINFELNQNTIPRAFHYVMTNTRKHTTQEELQLPVPATYVIDQKGLIEYVHFNEDYRERSTVSEILKYL